MSIAGGLPNAVDRAVATGCQVMQIFTRPSGQWRARPLPDAEVERFKARLAETGIGPVVAHASYLINLASPDAALRTRSVEALTDELDRADRLGLAGVVLHPGAYTTSTEREGITRIAEGLVTILAGRSHRGAELLLEHTAGQGTVLGHRFEQLRDIIDTVGDDITVGVCLDTCHLVGAGL